MEKEFNIDVPLHLRGIKLSQYQQWIKIMNKYEENGIDDEKYLKAKMLQVFCALPIEDTHKIPLHSFDGVVQHLGELFKTDTPLQVRFSMEDPKGEKLELGMIPELAEMTFGEQP